MSKPPARDCTILSGRLPYVAMALAYTLLRLPLLSLHTLHTASTSDTAIYEAIARTPLLGAAIPAGLQTFPCPNLDAIGFFTGARPFVVPLLYKLLGNVEQFIGVFQWLLATCSWLLLAAAFALFLRHARVRLAAVGILLLFALATPIVQWDPLLLSESVSISLLALFIAAWLWLLTTFSWWRVAAVVLVGTL